MHTFCKKCSLKSKKMWKNVYKLLEINGLNKAHHQSIFQSSIGFIYLYIQIPRPLGFEYLSIHLSIYPSIHLSNHQSIYQSIYPSTHLSIYPSIYQSIYLSIHPFIHVTICLSIYPSIYILAYSKCLHIVQCPLYTD